jgi:hypothetical protein
MTRPLLLALFAGACVVTTPTLREARPHPVDTDAVAPVEEEPGPALDTAAPEEEPPDEEPPPVLGADLCFPGADEAWATCVDVVPWSSGWGSDYAYPTSADPRYTRPVRFIDLAAWPGSLAIAPNFVLSEIAQLSKGPYGLVQPHLVDHLQALREASGGPLTITSGYRSPAYNEGVGGVQFSRHQWGDAADMQPSAVDLDTMGALCEAEGAAYVGYYEYHVHCDWRDDPLDPVLFTAALPARAAAPHIPTSARLVAVGGRWTAPAEGWDEGEPLRDWTAFDAAGRVLGTFRGRSFTPPPGAVRLTVVVGKQLTLDQPL